MDVNERAQSTVDRLNLIVAINNADDYQTAGIYWKAGKTAIEAIDDRYADDIDFAHREHKRLIAERDAVKKPVEAATKRIKGMMAAWVAEQERAREAERARLEAEARRQEEERKLAEAIQAEASGNDNLATAIMEETITTPTIAMPPAAPKVDGVIYRTYWGFTITDAAAIPREYLIPDEKAIRAVVTALKDNCKIPGIKVYSERR